MNRLAHRYFHTFVFCIFLLNLTPAFAQVGDAGFVKVTHPPGSMISLFNEGTTLYAGTNGKGVYRSDDGGKTWSPANSGIETARVYAFVAAGGNWYIGTDTGVYRSNDQGKTWTAVNQGLLIGTGASSKPREISALAFSGTALIAGAASTTEAADAPALYRSTDLGQSWSAVRAGLPAGDASPSVVTAGSVLLAVINGGIYRSIDNGQSWTSTGRAGVALAVVRQTAFSAVNDGVYRSEDQGQTWIRVRRPPEDSFGGGRVIGLTSSGTNLFVTDAAAASPSAIFYSVLHSPDLGATWINSNAPQRGGPFSPSPQPVLAAADRLFVGVFYPEPFESELYVRSGYFSPGSFAISSATYAAQMARESLASVFGLDLSSATAVAQAVPLPTELANTTLRVRDSAGIERIAPLLYVSPRQVNFQVPAGAAAGAAKISITSNGVMTGMAECTIQDFAPGFFTANMDGRGVPAALLLRIRGDGTSQYESIADFDAALNRFVPKPIDLGPQTDLVYLILFGTGMRNPPDRDKLRIVIGSGGEYAPAYIGAQGDLVGLDQVNLLLPRSLAGMGTTSLSLSLPGTGISNILQIRFK